MPTTHTTTFQVRFYECDAYGHLNNANYVRYMQQAAFDASAAVGWSVERYEASAMLWVLREVDIEYLQPVYYGEMVTVATWVTDIRRVASTRRYEFRRGDEVVARAITLWVFLDRHTMRLASISPEIRRSYAPDDDLSGERMDDFPAAAPRPDGTFHLQKRVEWRDIDTVQHVNSAAYFNYCEDASTQVGQHFGWSMARMIDNYGLAMVMRQCRIQYQTGAELDDTLDIATWLSAGRRATVTRHYVITRQDDDAAAAVAIAQARALWVCFDLARNRPARFPDQMIDDFAPNIALA